MQRVWHPGSQNPLSYNGYVGWCRLVLSSAKIGRSSWRYNQHTVARGLCEYYLERGDAPVRWHGDGLAPLGLAPGAVVQERELEALFARAVSPTSGAQLGAGWRDGSVTGHDLTFSAPKSVSAAPRDPGCRAPTPVLPRSRRRDRGIHARSTVVAH